MCLFCFHCVGLDIEELMMPVDSLATSTTDLHASSSSSSSSTAAATTSRASKQAAASIKRTKEAKEGIPAVSSEQAAALLRSVEQRYRVAVVPEMRRTSKVFMSSSSHGLNLLTLGEGRSVETMRL